MGRFTHFVVFLFAGSCICLSLSLDPAFDDDEDQPRNCTNKLGNCFDFDVSGCIDFDYGGWMQENCCEMCAGINATTQQKHQECKDLLTNCASYGDDICSVTEYTPWVVKNCAKHCNKCACEDKIDNCHSYGRSVCGVPEYKEWVKENCARSCGVCVWCWTPSYQTSYDNFDLGLNGPLGSRGCVYKGVVYGQGEEWTDGCDYHCRCLDKTNGFYRCIESCAKNWLLPVECKMNPAKPGKCCPTPSCPDGTILTPPSQLKLSI